MAKGRNTAALAGLAAATMMDDGDKALAKKVLGEAGKNVGAHLLAAGRNPIKYGKNMLGINAPEEEPAQMAKGGSASSRADGCAQRGKTRGKFV
jgi:ribosomal protein S7